MSDSTELAKDIGAMATAPAGGILLGSSVVATNQPCGAPAFPGTTCQNWFGSEFANYTTRNAKTAPEFCRHVRSRWSSTG
jgi:hypothetical protein